MTLVESVLDAVEALELTPADQAAARLALTYAGRIDAGGDLDRLGPQLLAVLESLLMTPRARAAAVKGGTGVAPSSSPLDELRARRAARDGSAPPVDPTAD